VLVDAGANAECTPAMLVQFAQMGAAYVAARFGTTAPSVGLLSIGEEPTKGTPLVKEAHGLLVKAANVDAGDAGGGFEFVGNLEGRDLLPSPADVIVTDGFTGNVALKALEGSLRFLFDTMLGVFGTDEATIEAAGVLLPHLLPIAAQFEPENTGGAMLLGTDGVCVISHGSSNATAMMNAVLVAHECATRGLADHVAAAVQNGGKS
jgi:glycerol-3-phosphate acyltransferase PlsX